MKVDVKIRVEATVELKPGDRIQILNGYRQGKILTINSIIERRKGVNVIFSDGTFRPITTYGLTWQKIQQRWLYD